MADATFLDNIIDGCGFEILSMKALIRSHKKIRSHKINLKNIKIFGNIITWR